MKASDVVTTPTPQPDREAIEDERRTRMRAAADEALSLWHETSGSIEIDVADQGRLHVIYPLAAHALEQVRAALILIDHGLPFPAEATPDRPSSTR